MGRLITKYEMATLLMKAYGKTLATVERGFSEEDIGRMTEQFTKLTRNLAETPAEDPKTEK